tara:strand:+ start:609 stop:908 length:300 start_codon:yes stop_codon:yes gene_type:complete
MKLVKYLFVFVFFGIALSGAAVGEEANSVHRGHSTELDVKRRNGVNMQIETLIPRSYKPVIIYAHCDNLRKDVFKLSDDRVREIAKQCIDNKHIHISRN